MFSSREPVLKDTPTTFEIKNNAKPQPNPANKPRKTGLRLKFLWNILNSETFVTTKPTIKYTNAAKVKNSSLG